MLLQFHTHSKDFAIAARIHEYWLFRAFGSSRYYPAWLCEGVRVWVDAEHEGVATRCRVLVVEDDPSSRRALVRLLRLKGFELTVASTVAEAMHQLDWKPTCILLDLMLPDGNGAAILEHIRDQHLPIKVAVTTGAGNWQALLGNGRLLPDALFTKPLVIERVVDWLNEPG